MAIESDAGSTPRAATQSTFRAAGRELIETVLLTLIVFMLIRSVVRNYKVEGFSMEPTLDNGQYLLVNKGAYWFGQPDLGDIIILRYPLDPNTYYVKRIIGRPGDTVEVRDGKVFVNGRPLAESYIMAAPDYLYQKQIVPPDDYFVLGDNRNNSSDSHAWGMLPASDVVGKAVLSYWPPKRWGLVPSATYSSKTATAPAPVN